MRVHIEAWLDFPEEDLEFDAGGELTRRIAAMLDELAALRARAEHGAALRDGLSIVIAGPPNAGKSSLLNRLAGYDAAIVTDIPGTTRDPLREHLSLGGLPVNVIDTAGLREAGDPVEQEGLRRARMEIGRADRILWVADARDPLASVIAAARAAAGDVPVTVVRNKIDLIDALATSADNGGVPVVSLSALTGLGSSSSRRICAAWPGSVPRLAEHSVRGAGMSKPWSGLEPISSQLASRSEALWSSPRRNCAARKSR